MDGSDRAKISTSPAPNGRYFLQYSAQKDKTFQPLYGIIDIEWSVKQCITEFKK